MRKTNNKSLKSLRILNKIKKAPTRPGVYFFCGKKGKILYIGKSNCVKARLNAHFRQGQNTFNALRLKLLNETYNVKWLETDSEIEALVLESELIKKEKPPFNILMRDDKNYLFAAVTKGEFPRIFLTHQPNQKESKRIKKYIGPFTDAQALKKTLQILRNIFPYCTCKKDHKNACLNAHIGRCRGFCCELKSKNRNKESKTRYNKNIESIIQILQGRRKNLLRTLKKEIKELSKKKQYEDAAQLRDIYRNLNEVIKHARVISTHKNLLRPRALRLKNISRILLRSLRIKSEMNRVEAYDISNIQGKQATGSMVVMLKGKINKNEYRKFRIKKIRKANDIAMLKQVLTRRLGHKDWPMPDLILIDGGKAQLNAAQQVVKMFKLNIPAIALAKKEEELYTEYNKKVPLSFLNNDLQILFKRIRDEAHRFAISYHKKIREAEFAQ